MIRNIFQTYDNDNFLDLKNSKRYLVLVWNYPNIGITIGSHLLQLDPTWGFLLVNSTLLKWVILTHKLAPNSSLTTLLMNVDITFLSLHNSNSLLHRIDASSHSCIHEHNNNMNYLYTYEFTNCEVFSDSDLINICLFLFVDKSKILLIY